uniref:Putative secreted protein n=1 Tax=Anopheles darlingi TaxID=43151 RepID=A0A2M4D842_ANODA
MLLLVLLLLLPAKAERCRKLFDKIWDEVCLVVVVSDLLWSGGPVLVPPSLGTRNCIITSKTPRAHHASCPGH